MALHEKIISILMYILVINVFFASARESKVKVKINGTWNRHVRPTGYIYSQVGDDEPQIIYLNDERTTESNSEEVSGATSTESGRESTEPPTRLVSPVTDKSEPKNIKKFVKLATKFFNRQKSHKNEVDSNERTTKPTPLLQKLQHHQNHKKHNKTYKTHEERPHEDLQQQPDFHRQAQPYGFVFQTPPTKAMSTNYKIYKPAMSAPLSFGKLFNYYRPIHRKIHLVPFPRGPPPPFNPWKHPTKHEPPKKHDSPEKHEPPKEHKHTKTHESPKKYEPPKKHEPPKEHKHTKKHESPKKHEPPEKHEPPKKYDPPKKHELPKKHSPPKKHHKEPEPSKEESSEQKSESGDDEEEEEEEEKEEEEEEEDEKDDEESGSDGEEDSEHDSFEKKVHKHHDEKDESTKKKGRHDHKSHKKGDKGGHDTLEKGFVTESGVKYNQEGRKRKGFESDTGYNSFGSFGKGRKKDYDEKHHTEDHDENKAKKAAAFEASNNHGNHHDSYRDDNGGKFNEHSMHKKGSKTVGYHNIFHKDDYKKVHTFYDDADHRGQFKKFGNEHENFDFKKGSSDDRQHHNYGHNDADHSTNGRFKKGYDDQEDKRYNNKHGNDKEHFNEEQYSNHDHSRKNHHKAW